MIKQTPSQKLISRIREELKVDLPEDTVIRRTHAGRNQKGNGAWVWFLYSPTRSYISTYGSAYTVTELLKQKELELYCLKLELFTEIIPKEK